MRHIRSRDKNEPAIVEALKAVGASVTSLTPSGKKDDRGVPDLLVGYRWRTFLLEVKNPTSASGKTMGGASRPVNGGDGTLTEGQIEWWKAWYGERPQIVTTPDEALIAIGAKCRTCGSMEHTLHPPVE